MPEGQVLEFAGVTKRFGAVAAVSDFTARIEPGVVTGFLGPNGAGKTTSLRVLLGLVRATSGTATIGGVPYAKLKNPLQTVGAVLEASSFHPGRSAANHLKVYAQAAGLPLSRVDETLATVGLSEVAGRKVGGFSLGMRQRLGLAYALLGDPGVLVLDEPANGLDPEGIKWMRGLLRELARQGRTVLVSSHLLAEVQQTADAVLIIAQGRLVFQGGLEDLSDPSEHAVVVDAPDRAALSTALRDAGMEFEVLRSGLTVRGAEAADVGAAAAAAGVALSSLARRGPSLEEVFLELVDGRRVHVAPEPEAVEPEAVEPEAVEAEPEAAVVDRPDEALPAEDEGVVVEDVADEDAADGARPSPASFAVASTGIIEVIPPEAADEAPAEETPDLAPADEAPAEAPDEPGLEDHLPEEPNAAERSAAEPAAEEPAGEEPPAEEHGEPDDGADETLPDEPQYAEHDVHREAVKTEADLEADRFFSSFDQSGDGEQPQEGAAEASDDDAEHGEQEGGEQR